MTWLILDFFVSLVIFTSIYDLLRDTFNECAFIASLIASEIVSCLDVLFRHLPTWARENTKSPHSGLSIFGPRFETGALKVSSRVTFDWETIMYLSLLYSCEFTQRNFCCGISPHRISSHRATLHQWLDKTKTHQNFKTPFCIVTWCEISMHYRISTVTIQF